MPNIPHMQMYSSMNSLDAFWFSGLLFSLLQWEEECLL